MAKWQYNDGGRKAEEVKGVFDMQEQDRIERQIAAGERQYAAEMLGDEYRAWDDPPHFDWWDTEY